MRHQPLATALGLVVLIASVSPAVAVNTPKPSERQARPRSVDTQQHVLGPGQHRSGDAPWALGYVSLGDSYSAGIGTGVEVDEESCRLGRHGYPALIFKDLVSLARPSPLAFQWRSCTGAATTDLLFPGGQIASLNRSLPADFATLSIGGNDLGFFDVINACVFRFYSFYSGTCDEALRRAADLVASPDFEVRLQVALLELLDAVRWERHPRFAVAVTGYARFFNAETEACNDASLGVWWGGPKLPMTLRAEMNALVLSVNAKLQRSIDAVNARFAGRHPRAFLVDYDAAFEGHRFCEPGVDEPDYSRLDTWFFLVGGPDNGRQQNQTQNGTRYSHPSSHFSKPPLAHILPPSSPIVDPDRCLGPALEAGDWGRLTLCHMAMAKRKNPSLRQAREGLIMPQDNNGWYVPTYYAKVFHPRSLGQESIRDAIYQAWNDTFQESLL